jgi:tRNA pseudouridine38-40 synthase
VLDRRVLLLVQYDGTEFKGYQRQAVLRTIQGTLEDAISQLTREEASVLASSRTDAGVHSLGLPVLFFTRSRIPLHGLVRALNTLLPPDVSVSDACEAPDGFDVRKSSLGKTYRYRVWNSRTRCAIRRRSAWFVPFPLDVLAMRRAAGDFVGEHDFSSFRASSCQAHTPIRRVTAVDVEVSGPTDAGARIHGDLSIVVRGNAFLQNMIRIMAGTLVEIGRGYRSDDAVRVALASRNRSDGGETAPGHGLILEAVHYHPDPFAAGGAGLDRPFGTSPPRL